MKPAASFGQVLGEVVVWTRKQKGLSQGDVAKKLAVSQSSLSRLERGQTAFNVPQLRRTAATLNVAASKLLADAERAASALGERGIAVLDELPEGEEPSTVAVAASVIETAVTTAVLNPGRIYKQRPRNKQQVHVRIRRGDT